MNEKIKSPASHKQQGNNKNQLNDTSSSAQRQRLLEWLYKQPITTIEARHLLNILAPAPRIFELRHQGFNIKTFWVRDVTPEGLTHCVARYVLMSGGKNAS